MQSNQFSDKFPHAPGGLGGLGYVGIDAPDPIGWRRFAIEVFGLEPALIPPGPREAGMPVLGGGGPDEAGVAPDGSVFLKMDRRQWRLAVHPAETPGLAYLGFELPLEGDLDAAMESISKSGVSIRAGTSQELEARGVGDLAVMEDPAGHRIELFCRPIIDQPMNSTSDIEFLTGSLGMGHAVLFVPEIEPALEFYRGVLGFLRSDYMRFGPDGMGIHFLRCTRRHHSMALVQLGPPSGLQHLMFEATSLDGVGKTLDRAIDAGVTITSSLGRHRNDKTVSFYMKGPSGFDIEIGWGGLLVDEDWVEHEFAGGGDDWGHHGLDPSALLPDE